MPLAKKNTRGFHRKLFAGIMQQTVTLLKRDDDQQQGTVRAIILYQTRRGIISKHMEPIQGDVAAVTRCVWHIPRSELERVGVAHLNALDRIVDHDGPENLPRYWQPESTTLIEVKLFENEIDLHCLRVDPPAGTYSVGINL